MPDKILTAGENITVTIDTVGGTVTIATPSETIRDLIAGFIVAGANISVTHDDTGNTLTIATDALDAEEVRDLLGTTLLAGTGLVKTVDDALDTVTLAIDSTYIGTTVDSLITGGTGITVSVDAETKIVTIAAPDSLTTEQAQDMLATFLVAGANITLTYDDVANTLTIASTGGAGGLTTEDVQDVVAAMIVAGDGLTGTYDDTAGTYTLDADAAAGERSAINFLVIDNGVDDITAGIKGEIQIGGNYTIVSCRLYSPDAGDCVLDINRATDYASLPTFSSITASAKPTLTAAQKYEDGTLTGWDTSLADGEWLQFEVESASGIKRVTVSLIVERA